MSAGNLPGKWIDVFYSYTPTERSVDYTLKNPQDPFVKRELEKGKINATVLL